MARPTSIVRTRPSRATSSAASSRVGIRTLRAKSLPVPSGDDRELDAVGHPIPMSPSTTSWTVPSPPTTTSLVAPPSTASRARSPRCPGRSLWSVFPSSPAAAARRASSGHRRPVEPFAAAGLTRKTRFPGSAREAPGSSRVFTSLPSRWRFRDAKAPGYSAVTTCRASSVIWSTAERHLVVGDADELALDDHVRDDEHAAGLDPPQCAQGEEDGRLHLHREDPTLRPAARQPLIGLVEDVARDDRADADGLAELLCLVHRLVDEPEVGRRRVGLARRRSGARSRPQASRRGR